MPSTAAKMGISLICLLTISTASCKKFLESYSQNNSFVESAKDLNELLIGDAYMDFQREIQTEMFHLMDDDAQLGLPRMTPSSPAVITIEHGLHFWQLEPRLNSLGTLANTDAYYNGLYGKIARINTILSEAGKLRNAGEPGAVLDRISGEAQYLRAFYYYLLVNFYGKPYKPATAHTDFGIPLKTDPEIKKQFVTRSSVKEVYDQILKDLQDAAKNLAHSNTSTNIRVSQAAVYALLSRIYLYTENYALAADYASRIIDMGQYQLTDLNQHIISNDFLNRSTPEVVFTLGGSRISSWMGLPDDAPTSRHMLVSTDLIQSYQQHDLRLPAFYLKNSRGNYRIAKKRKTIDNGITDVSDKYAIRLSEMYLNKAEALAAMDRFEEARATLAMLLKNRFKPADVPVMTAEGAALIGIIREERRRELCFEGHRWFDLRRYAVNSKYPFSKSIRHRSIEFSGTEFIENGYYELGTYAEDEAAYTLPIANDEIDFNQGLIKNETRKVRPLKH